MSDYWLEKACEIKPVPGHLVDERLEVLRREFFGGRAASFKSRAELIDFASKCDCVDLLRHDLLSHDQWSEFQLRDPKTSDEFAKPARQRFRQYEARSEPRLIPLREKRLVLCEPFNEMRRVERERHKSEEARIDEMERHACAGVDAEYAEIEKEEWCSDAADRAAWLQKASIERAKVLADVLGLP